MDNETMTIREVKSDILQLKMALEGVIENFNKKTGAQITGIAIKYFYSAKVGDLPDVTLEVKI